MAPWRVYGLQNRFWVYICGGEMAEWSIAAVLKTVDCNRSGGSNPSLSASQAHAPNGGIFYLGMSQACLSEFQK
jgi:hypothetical protein